MTAYEEDGAAAMQAEVVADTAGTARSRRAAATPPRSLGRRLRTPLMVAAPVVVAVVALYFYLSGGRFVSTDDAFVQAARVNVSTQISGQVVELDVRENQGVRAGQVLFRLDGRAYDVAVEQAEAALASAEQAVRATQATYGAEGVNVKAAQDTLAYALKEDRRQRVMTASGVSSQQQLDAAAHNVDIARAQLAGAQQQQANVLASLGGQSGSAIGGYASVRQAQAALDRAQLNQSYAVVRAPQDGVVTRVEQLQVGDYVNAAQPLFDLVAQRLWIEANYKEDQLANMRPGQPATIRIDAYPGRTFEAHVASLSPGTGSSFAVLPPENANGNWVKVVQRLPVRLVFDSDTSELRVPLEAGLSAVAAVDTAHRRTVMGYGLGGPAQGAAR